MSNTGIDITEENPEVIALTETTEVVVTSGDTTPVIVTVETPEVCTSSEVIEVGIQESSQVQIVISESVAGGGGGIPDITGIPLTVEREYAEPIPALKAVRALNSTQVVLGNETTFSDSKVMGISLSTGIVGFRGELIIFGVLKDLSFTFPVNDLLYLGASGSVTNVAPSGVNFSTTIGYSLGVGEIFINIKDPIEL